MRFTRTIQPAVPILVQARMGSQRLPGKVLADICGRPLLTWLLERLRSSQLASEIVVLTTTEPADDAVVAAAARSQVEAMRGHPTDVLERYGAAVRTRGDEALVRVSGDSPLLDARTVDIVLDRFLRSDVDIAANHREREWPVGTAVEALTADCLARIQRAATDPRHREHVTLYAYEHPDDFAIAHVPAPSELIAPSLRLCVDSADDLAAVRALCAQFAPRQDFTLAEIVSREVAAT
ncbi:MAG TPA: NTP transferase domain-containing protein [Solirubrobacteraceae bacterium]|nr:NTP transferase domain-containing protein [Solirubrobacteraceae bacterium]